MVDRIPREDDQGQVEKAYEIVNKIIEANPDVEGALLFGAMMSVAVDNFIDSGVSYEEWCQELDNMKKVYKHWWNEDLQKELKDFHK